MRKTLMSLVLITLSGLSGCAGLSRNQCLASDWETIGYRDGMRGSASTTLLRHQDACMKHGIKADRTAYMAGWADGVERYCQAANAFHLGERGASFSNVCPSHLEQDFHSAYLQGRQLYVAGAEIASIERAIEDREYRLREVKSEIAAIAGDVIDHESSTAERATSLLGVRDLLEEQGNLQRELVDLAAELALKKDHLEHLRHSIAQAH